MIPRSTASGHSLPLSQRLSSQSGLQPWGTLPPSAGTPGSLPGCVGGRWGGGIMARAPSCVPETQPEQEEGSMLGHPEEAPPRGLAVTCLPAPVYHRASWEDMPRPSEGEHTCWGVGGTSTEGPGTQGSGMWPRLPTQAPEQGAEDGWGEHPPTCRAPPAGSACVCPGARTGRCAAGGPSQLPSSACSSAAPPRDPLPWGFPCPPPCRLLLQPRSPTGHVVPAASPRRLEHEGQRAGGAGGWRCRLAGCPGSVPGC